MTDRWNLRCSTCGKFLAQSDLNSGRSTYKIDQVWNPWGNYVEVPEGECWRCKEKKLKEIDQIVYIDNAEGKPTLVLRSSLAILLILFCTYLGYSNYNLRQENKELTVSCVLWKSRMQEAEMCLARTDGRFRACDLIRTAQQDIIDDITTKTLTVTAYTACPEECNNDPFHTAIMTRPSPGRTVAVSWDLISWLGRDIYIEGLGIRKVEDLMNPRWTNRIDIMVPYVDDAREFGVQERQVVLLGSS